MARKIVLALLILISIAGIIWGITGIYQIITKGHGVMNTTSDMPWGILISTYVFLVLVSTGCTFVNFFGHLVGLKEYAVIGPRIIAIALFTVLGGLTAIFLELGWPFRSIYFLTSPNFDSPMAWMMYLYATYIIFIIAEFLLFKKAPESMAAKIIMWLAFISAVATHSTLGGLFGVLEARPYYYGALTPILFLSIAFLSGSAISVLIAYSAGEKHHPTLTSLRKMVGVGIVLVFIFYIWRFTVGSFSNAEGYEVFQMAAKKFWIISVFLGLVVPFVLVFISSLKGLRWIFPIAAITILINQFFSRHTLFVVEGFKIPMFKSAWTPDIITYAPSSVEVSIVVGAFAFVLLLYSIAEFTGILESPFFVEEEVSQ